MQAEIIKSKEMGPNHKIVWVVVKDRNLFNPKDYYYYAHCQGCAVIYFVNTKTMEKGSAKHQKAIENRLFHDFAQDFLFTDDHDKPKLVSIKGGKFQ